MFIVFEGAEAVGKTTQLNLLRQRLEALNQLVVCTREPGGTPFAQRIRQLFKAPLLPHEPDPLPMTELLLILAARHEHVSQVISPALRDGKVVLCDRFLDSTYVYQSICGHLPKKQVDDLSFLSCALPIPDLTVVLSHESGNGFLDVRQAFGQQEADRMDMKELAYHQGIQKGFLKVVSEKYEYPVDPPVCPRRVLISASQSVQKVHEDIWAIVESLLPDKKGSL